MEFDDDSDMEEDLAETATNVKGICEAADDPNGVYSRMRRQGFGKGVRRWKQEVFGDN